MFYRFRECLYIFLVSVLCCWDFLSLPRFVRPAFRRVVCFCGFVVRSVLFYRAVIVVFESSGGRRFDPSARRRMCPIARRSGVPLRPSTTSREGGRPRSSISASGIPVPPPSLLILMGWGDSVCSQSPFWLGCTPCPPEWQGRGQSGELRREQGVG